MVLKQRLRTAAPRGVRLSLKTNEAGKFTLTLVYKGKTVGMKVVSTTRAGTKPVTVKLTKKGKKALGRARSAALTAKLTARDALGNTRSSSKRFSLRR
jgi:hypothetical protein